VDIVQLLVRTCHRQDIEGRHRTQKQRHLTGNHLSSSLRVRVDRGCVLSVTGLVFVCNLCHAQLESHNLDHVS